MRTIFVYIFKEIGRPSLIALIFFLTLSFFSQLIRFGDEAQRLGITIGELAFIAMLLIPEFIILALPIALLIGAMIGFGRMTAEGEILVFRAFGVRFYKLCMVPLLIGMGAMVLTTVTSNWLSPMSIKQLQINVTRAAYRLATEGIIAGRFVQLTDNIIIHVTEREGKEQGAFKGVVVYNKEKKDAPMTIFASRARFLSDPSHGLLRLILSEGSVHRIEAEKKHYQMMSFEKLDYVIDLSNFIVKHLKFAAPVQGLTQEEIGQEITRYKSASLSTKSLELAYYRRHAYPIASVILILLGSFLGMLIRKGGRGKVIPIAAVLALFYYLLVRAGDALGLTGNMPLLIAAWLPNLIFIAILALLIYLLRTLPMG